LTVSPDPRMQRRYDGAVSAKRVLLSGRIWLLTPRAEAAAGIGLGLVPIKNGTCSVNPAPTWSLDDRWAACRGLGRPWPPVPVGLSGAGGLRPG